MLGGGADILIFLALSLLIAAKRKIEAAKNNEEFGDVIRKVIFISNNTPAHSPLQLPDFVDLDAVAQTAIELWEKPILTTMTRDARNLVGRSLGY